LRRSCCIAVAGFSISFLSSASDQPPDPEGDRVEHHGRDERHEEQLHPRCESCADDEEQVHRVHGLVERGPEADRSHDAGKAERENGKHVEEAAEGYNDRKVAGGETNDDAVVHSRSSFRNVSGYPCRLDGAALIRLLRLRPSLAGGHALLFVER
jgi:hypothetical protein